MLAGGKLRIPLETERSTDPAYEVNYVSTDAWLDNTPGQAQHVLDKVLEARQNWIPSSLVGVHCHSGVARTGTFISLFVAVMEVDRQLDSTMGMKPDEVKVSIEEIVREGSLQRLDFVGQDKQYNTIYQALDLYIEGLKSKKYKTLSAASYPRTEVSLEDKGPEDYKTRFEKLEARMNVMAAQLARLQASQMSSGNSSGNSTHDHLNFAFGGSRNDGSANRSAGSQLTRYARLDTSNKS